MGLHRVCDDKGEGKGQQIPIYCHGYINIVFVVCSDRVRNFFKTVWK